MPQNRAGRFIYALLIVALMLIIGRNVYRRTLNRRLAEAVEARNVAAVRDLLARGADAASRKSLPRGEGVPLLTLTINSLVMSPTFGASHHEELACLLIEQGGLRNVDETQFNTYLLTACRFGNAAIVHSLLEHSVEASARTPTHSAVDMAIEYAAAYRFPAAPPAEWSDEERLKVEADRQRHLAVSQELVRMLQEHGAHLNLWQAARIDNAEAARAMLDTGTPVDGREPNTSLVRVPGTAKMPPGPTALIMAAQAGSLHVVRLLLGHGASVNPQDGDTSSPLRSAISGQNLEIARLLLQKGAEVNDKVTNPAYAYSTPLVLACNSLPQLVPELLQRGADAKTAGGEALRNAISSRHPELVALLLKHGARCQGRFRSSVLYAAIQHQPELVPLFLAQEAGVRQMPDKGAGLIAQAVHYKRKNLIVPLLRAGAVINAPEFRGMIGFKMGAAGGDAQNYSTPLIEAVAQDADMVEFLLKQGAAPDVTNSRGETPLIIAAQSGNIEAARLLLKYRANVDGEGKMRHTPLHYARTRKNAAIIALLQQAGGHER